MIERLRAEGGISDERVLTAMRTVPRHLFIDEALASRAYEDTALPIGNGQTISQPWVVARMTAALIENGIPTRVLEVGTGSGYQASVLATLGLETYSVERIEELLRVARAPLPQPGPERAHPPRRRPRRLARVRAVRRHHRHRRRRGAGGVAVRTAARGRHPGGADRRLERPAPAAHPPHRRRAGAGRPGRRRLRAPCCLEPSE